MSRVEISETQKKEAKALQDRLEFSNKMAEKVDIEKSKLSSELLDAKKELRDVQNRNDTLVSENDISHSKLGAINECLLSPETVSGN